MHTHLPQPLSGKFNQTESPRKRPRLPLEKTNQNFKSKKQKKSIFWKEILYTFLQKNYILMGLLIKNKYFHILQLIQIPQLVNLLKQHGMNQILKQRFQKSSKDVTTKKFRH